MNDRYGNASVGYVSAAWNRACSIVKTKQIVRDVVWNIEHKDVENDIQYIGDSLQRLEESWISLTIA
jgi:hypothetical protein